MVRGDLKRLGMRVSSGVTRGWGETYKSVSGKGFTEEHNEKDVGKKQFRHFSGPGAYLTRPLVVFSPLPSMSQWEKGTECPLKKGVHMKKRTGRVERKKGIR